MLERIKAWYQAALAWLGASESGARKEQLEDALTEGRLRDIIERQIAVRQMSRRGRFAQVLRGGARPLDREEDFPLGFTKPTWADFEINEWEGPDGHGFSLRFFVTETDRKEWVLALSWNKDRQDFSMEPWRVSGDPA